MQKKKTRQGSHPAKTDSAGLGRSSFSFLIGRGKKWLGDAAKISLPTALFVLSLAIYAAVRVIRLTDFPIYFFTDEAAQTILAQDWLRDGFHNYAGEFLPTYFENGGKYNLGFSVYAQVLPLILLGKSIFVTRLTSVFFTWLAAIGIGLASKKILQLKHWWVGTLVLSVTPSWFLHSRTAFETALAVSLYALFLCLYLAYRFINRRYLYPALLLGGLSFYSYSSMQPVVLATGVLLLFLDGVYHFRGWKTAMLGAGELILLSIPYVRFVFAHPDESQHQLAMLNSYWVGASPFVSKLSHFMAEYLKGFNPLFWYGTDPHELIRHVMLDYGHLPRLLMPFLVIGFALCLYHLKDPRYRILLGILMVAPIGAAVVQLGITRILVMVIPVTFLTAVGLSQCMEWLERIRIPPLPIALGTFALLVGMNAWMLVDSVRNGPTWFQDYSLDGMQYGTKQIFPSVQQYLKEHPDVRLILSPSWANGTDVIARFMMSDPLPIELGSIDGYFDEYREITPQTVFVMIPSELERVRESDKFKNIHILRTLDYPNGIPGFYYVSLEYVDGIQTRLQAEREARKILQEDQVVINGVNATVRYSALDMGVIGSAFDGNDATVIRTLEANPLVIELVFSVPVRTTNLRLLVGGTTTQIAVDLESTDGTHYRSTLLGNEESHPRELVFALGQSMDVVTAHFEIKSVYDPDPSHVHLWELTFEQ